eukprot:62119-Pleurochrysis_carterae.AAC.4
MDAVVENACTMETMINHQRHRSELTALSFRLKVSRVGSETEPLQTSSHLFCLMCVVENFSNTFDSHSLASELVLCRGND